MKSLVKSFVKWLIIVLATLTVIVWTVALTRAQHPEHDHLADMEEDIRFKSAIFLNVDEQKVFFKKETKYKLDLFSLDFDSKSLWDRSKPTNGCVVVILCITHSYLYALYPCKAREDKPPLRS